MDCVDCHNRPAHIYRQPAWEVDLAMDQGAIDKTLPFIKREGLRAVQVDYPSHEAARDGISADILSFYKKNYPQLVRREADDIRKAGQALGDIYSWNVFPQMKVTWGTYPNHLGHKQSPGLFPLPRQEAQDRRTARRSRRTATCATRCWPTTRRIRRSSTS